MKGNVISIGLKLLSAFSMFYFALPKLRGLPVSVKSFNQFSEVLGISSEGFRYFTGASELITAVVLLASIFFRGKAGNYLSILGYVLLFGIMVGSLATEFFVRVSPIPMLVNIAIVLLLLSVWQIVVAVKAIGR